MPQPFFPHSVVLAWAFYVVLVGITFVATYTDLRNLTIPKWLTLPALGLGLLFNVVLGAWVGPEGPRGSSIKKDDMDAILEQVPSGLRKRFGF